MLANSDVFVGKASKNLTNAEQFAKQLKDFGAQQIPEE